MQSIIQKETQLQAVFVKYSLSSNAGRGNSTDKTCWWRSQRYNASYCVMFASPVLFMAAYFTVFYKRTNDIFLKCSHLNSYVAICSATVKKCKD